MSRHLPHFVSIIAGLIPAAALGQTQPAPTIDAGTATRTEAPEPARNVPHSTAIETPPRVAGEVPTSGAITPGAIRVDGGDDLSQTEMMTAIAPFIGHRLSPGDVQDLLSAISGIARAHGYLFARSSIPTQTMTAGVLHIALNEGRVDALRVEGDEHGVVAAVLAPLIGRAPKREEVERRLMLAGDIPGVSIGRTRYAVEQGRGTLIVQTTFDRFAERAVLDNRGLRSLGPERAQAAFDARRLILGRDALSVQALITPIQPRELFALYGRYAVQPTLSGTEVALYGNYGETHPGDQWSAQDPHGESRTVGLSVSQPLVRSRAMSLWVTAQADSVAVDDWWAGELSRRDRVTTLGASANGYVPLKGGRLRIGAGVTQGVLALGASRRDDPLATRFDAGSDFTLFNAWGSWEGRIIGPISARLAASGQWTTDPLPAVEQITVGGPYFGRGYNFSERFGDEGVLGAAELRARIFDTNTGLVRGAQLYTFADAGHVASLETSFGSGALYSAGAGTRISLSGRVTLDLEAAFPLTAVRYDSGDRSPRLSFSLGTSF